MARDYTATELIASVQQRAQIALAARDFGTAQILRLFNEEIDGYLVPFVAQRKLEFWVESTDLAVSAGTASYAIPSVAMGGKLRAIALLQGGIPYLLDQIDLPIAVASQGTQLNASPPSGYYFMGNSIVLFPPPSSGSTLRVYYYRRPSQIVLPIACVQITGFPGGAAGGFFRVTATAVPTPYAIGTLVDLVSNVPNFTPYVVGVAIGQMTSTTIDIAGAQPAGLAVGDWVSLAGTAPVITGCPADLINLLLQEVALKVSEAKGSEASTKLLAAGLAKAEASAGWTIQQRNDGAMRKLSAFPSDVAGYGWLYG